MPCCVWRSENVAALEITETTLIGLPVVAEGIETEDQLELVRGAGCGDVQGFLLGRPQLPEQVIPTLT